MSKLIAAVPHGSGVSPCCCAGNCSLELQTKGATATMCGFEEYSSPSSPPRKYRTQTLSGSCSVCRGGRVCGGSGSGVQSESFSGTYKFDASSCGETNAQDNLFTNDDPDNNGDKACGYTGSGTHFTPGASFGGPNTVGILSFSVSSAPTSVQWNDTACNTGGYNAVSNVKKQLSDEDTIDSAIARANAGIGSWTPCSGGGSSCSAFKAARGSGVFSASYRSTQVRVTVTYLTPGTSYTVTIQLQRRVNGVGSFSDYATLTVVFTASASSYTSSWIDVPVDEGYEVAVSSCISAFT